MASGWITLSCIGLALAMVLYIPFPFIVKTLMRRKFLSTVRKSGCTCLTFDDGPCPVATPQILDLLRQRGIKATFFLVGERIEKFPEVVDRIVADGHEIGEHSYSHSHPWKCSPLRSLMDLIKGNRTLKRYEALQSTTWLRPPYGKLNLLSLLYVWIMKKQVAFWDIDPKDYREYSGRKVAQTVLDRFHAGSVILLHDGRNGSTALSTIAATRFILGAARKSKLRFATIGEALTRGQSDKKCSKRLDNDSSIVSPDCPVGIASKRAQRAAAYGWEQAA